MDCVIIIPAYEPSEEIIELCKQLSEYRWNIVIVDDGSGKEYRGIFDDCGLIDNVVVLRHAINLGKGRALKT